MLILIDADPIVYRCGFASERTGWHIVYEDAGGNVKEVKFDADEETSAGEQMHMWLALNGARITVLDKSRLVTPDPVSYALRATQVQIESIIEECEKHFNQPGKMLMWISGRGGSYRDKIASVRPYKGNRDPTHKPYHYDEIRDYLRTRYGSFVTNGIEADDAVSIFARQQYETGGESLVIATIDKDLDQIPGNHYNYMNKVFYAITETEAERFFVYQILAGDTTDNVVGVWRCGASAATKLLGGMAFGASTDRQQPNAIASIASGAQRGNAALRGRTAERNGGGYAEQAGSGAVAPFRRKTAPAWWGTIVRAFADSQCKPGCPYAQHNPEAVAIEMAQLVKLQEYSGQLWHPYGDLVVPGFGEENFDG